MSKKKGEEVRTAAGSGNVAGTGGEVDGIVMALIEAANDKDDSPKAMVGEALHTLGKKKPALVLSSCEHFLLKHKRLPLPHRVAILETMELILKDTINDVQPELALRLCTLASNEMTQKQEIVQEWQSAAATVIVALGSVYGQIVLDDLLSRFEAGKVPHYYVVKTLGDFAVTNVFTVVPALENTLAKCLPMLGMIKQENMKWAFTKTFAKFCDAIITYVANIDRAPDKSITVGKFSVQTLSALEVMFNAWLTAAREPKLRIAIVECVGLMSHVISRDKLEELMPKLIPGLLALYKKYPADKITITQGLGQVLSAAVADNAEILSPHLDVVMQTLYPLVQVQPNYAEPQTVKAYNEILRAFECICRVFSDRLLSFLFQKLEDNNEDARAGCLGVFRHLVNSGGETLKDKKELIVSGLRPVLVDKSLKVRSAMAQLIMAMSHHDYLSLEGGNVLLQFIVDQCAIDVDAGSGASSGKSQRSSKKPEEATTSPLQLKMMCENALQLSTSTIPCMRPVLWPYLFEFLVPGAYEPALPGLCRALGTLAEALRDEDDEIYDLDYDVLVNLPRPQELIARLMVFLGHPLEKQRGHHILYLFEGISPNIHDDVVDLWDDVIPRLLAYLDKNCKGDAWDQQAWEDLVLKLLSRTLDAVNDEEWVLAVGQFLGKHYELYTGMPELKNMLSKCLGVVLRKSSNKQFINEHLALMFQSVNHANQIEREGCARGFGFTAYSHLDLVLEKLKDITKTDMVAKSSGFFGLVKDKSATDIARIKATLMLCYGFVTLYAKANLITSRVEVNILATINPHFTNVKETQVKENLIRCVDLIGKSLHPSHLKSDKFILHRRGDLLSHMLAYMKAESKERLSTEIRALSMDACTTLLTLEPKLADAELFEMVDAATQAALDLGPVDDDSADMAELMQQVLKSLKRLLSTILRKDVSPSCLESIMKHLGRWMDAKKDHQRAWMIECYRDLLENYFNFLVETSTKGEDQGTIESFGRLVSGVIPRCTDPIESVRKDALGCVQWILRIHLCYRGFLDEPDNLVEAISKLEARAAKPESSQQFAVVNDLAKVLAKKVTEDDLYTVVEPLMNGLSDSQASSASGACVVLNGLFRLRGAELSRQVSKIIDTLDEKMKTIDNERTRTGVFRAIRTLAAHHLGAVMKRLLSFDFPYAPFATETWQTLVTDEKLSPQVFEGLIRSIQTSRPYDEDAKQVKTPALAAIRATGALKEVLSVEDVAEVIQDNYARILSLLIVRIGCTAGVKPKDKLDPNGFAVECLKTFIVASKSTFIETELQETNMWDNLSDEQEYPNGITAIAAAVCKNVPQQVPTLVEELEPILKQVYDSQRAVAAAVFAEFINQGCAGSVKLVNRLKNALLTKLVDHSHEVRMLVIRGLGNVASVSDEQMKKHSTTVLSAMMTGMDDRDDPHDLITLEAMKGLSKVLAKVEEESVRQILINISLRIRPCFEKDKGPVRAAAIRLFGNLSRFGDGPSRAPFSEQIHANLISLVLHLKDEDADVIKACKESLRLLGPLLDCDAITEVFNTKLTVDGSLHYGEFCNDFCKLLIAQFSDKINFYTMGCVNFFKSDWSAIKASAAIFVGFLLGNLPKRERQAISKEHVCGELIRLLKDPSVEVRAKAAESMSLLHKF